MHSKFMASLLKKWYTTETTKLKIPFKCSFSFSFPKRSKISSEAKTDFTALLLQAFFQCVNWQENSIPVKKVNLEHLLFHHRCAKLSFSKSPTYQKRWIWPWGILLGTTCELTAGTRTLSFWCNHPQFRSYFTSKTTVYKQSWVVVRGYRRNWEEEAKNMRKVKFKERYRARLCNRCAVQDVKQNFWPLLWPWRPERGHCMKAQSESVDDFCPVYVPSFHFGIICPSNHTRLDRWKFNCETEILCLKIQQKGACQNSLVFEKGKQSVFEKRKEILITDFLKQRSSLLLDMWKED